MKHLLVACGIVFAASMSAVCDGDAGVRRWLRLESEVEAADWRIAALREEIAALTREAEQLESDPFAIERAIREDLELARPGETVVRMPSNLRFP